MRGQAQTKQEAAKVLQRHGSRKRPSSAKAPGAKRAACSTVAAAHPLITSVFVPAAQLEASSAAAAAAGAAPNSRGARATSAAAASKPSIKSFFTHVAAQGAASTEVTARSAAPAAAPAAISRRRMR